MTSTADTRTATAGLLEGVRAVVTGAGRGIGRAEALALAGAGAEVVVHNSSSADTARGVVDDIRAAGGRAHLVRADLSDPDQVPGLIQEVVQTLGGLDVVIGNAGIEHFGALGTVTAKEIDDVFAVNTRAPFLVAQEAQKSMLAGGRIILTSSISATTPFPGHAIYSGSKAAVSAMVQCLALDLAPRGITVNAIAPGGTDSAMAARYGHLYESDLAPAVVPMGRLAEPAEIADAVLFLASPLSRWITGQTLRVSGGQ